MLPNGVFGTGISAHKRANDLGDFGAELDMIEALGVDAIELPTYDMDLVFGARIRRPQLEALKRACAGRPVAYSVHGPLSINFMDDAWRLPLHLDVLEASLEVAAEVGARHYVIHSGLVPASQAAAIEDGLARQREWLARAGDRAVRHGVVLCVETLFGAFDGSTVATGPARLAAELSAIGHPAVAATMDISHAYIKLDRDGRRADLVSELAELAPHARHLHIHDSFGRQDDIWMYSEGERAAFGHGDLHLPVGWGDIPFDAILEACTFPEGALFNIELQQRYWYAAEECVAATRALAARARVTRSAAAAE